MNNTEYNAYTYLSPPRAESAVMAASLRFYETRGWLAQVKKNGTNSVIFVPPVGKPFAKTRHEKDPEHKLWAFTDDSIKVFEAARTKGWSVFNAELLHSKGNGIYDTNYIHDVLVYDGQYLLGKSYIERYQLLQKIFKVRKKTQSQSHYIIDNNTWLAKNHAIGFKVLFNRLTNEDEGLVLKNPNGILSIRNNAEWTVKCRLPHKNFGF